jgi:hypothetical protein
MRTSAGGSGLPLRPLGFLPVFGASPLGQGISVNLVSPVPVEKARKAAPSVPSESKSMISRTKSSEVASGLLALEVLNVFGGGGVLMGSKPRLS